MKAFLEYVAEDILNKHAHHLARVAVVFPNKRASLFINEHLARLARRPIWSPAYMTISELFRRHSNLSVADPIKQVCDLHKSYCSITGSDETLDRFYGWGQLLLSDFDDIDKNMADADRVLANLSDIHELDGVDYLTEGQRQAIARFFSNFSPDHNSLLKERFLRLWSHMAEVYHDFNRRLLTQQLAYEGALYRQVAERADDIDFAYDTYIFVGFNLIQRAEQHLFNALRRQGKACFYWDFDHSYMAKAEAGTFISQYMADFPNELDTDRDDIYRQMDTPKTITIASAPTENIQARYASLWLTEGDRIPDGRRTAIVMCDEQLLPTIINCLPDGVDKVNITTGYPLSQTPASSLMSQLIGLRTAGYDRQRDRFRLRQVCILLHHPYVGLLSDAPARLCQELNQQKVYFPAHDQLAADDATQLLFRPFATDNDFNSELLQWMCDVFQLVARHTTADPLMQESVFRAYTLLNRLLALVGNGDMQADVTTLQRLVTQLAQTTAIPFHGEPAEGIQVMGVLETRNLDFDHLLLLSCNEGNMPRGINDTSVIPYSLRKAYGLTTADNKVALYSYYFYRLVQRASDITIVYNNATTDGRRGEMSRFALQLMAETHHNLHTETLQAEQAHTPFAPPTIEKDDDIMQRLHRRFDAKPDTTRPLLTPTAINRYQRCQLQFYYSYVYGLREPDTTDDDSIDNRIFGNIFHEASRIVYSTLMEKSRRILASDIAQLLKERVFIERAVDLALRTELFQIRQEGIRFHMDLNGLQIINREVILQYLRQLLTIDQRLAPFTIIDLEGDVVEPLVTPHISTTIGGRIDRLDCICDAEGERIRVIDYKTGAGRLRPLPTIESVFSQDSLANHSDYYLQTILYATIVSRQQPQPVRVSPALLFIQHAGGDDYDPTLLFGKQPISDVAPHSHLFGQLLADKVDEIFDPAVPFVPTSDRTRCQSCPYRNLCFLQPGSPSSVKETKTCKNTTE